MAALLSNGWMNCFRWMETLLLMDRNKSSIGRKHCFHWTETLLLMDRNNSSIGRKHCFWWMETFLSLCELMVTFAGILFFLVLYEINSSFGINSVQKQSISCKSVYLLPIIRLFSPCKKYSATNMQITDSVAGRLIW